MKSRFKTLSILIVILVSSCQEVSKENKEPLNANEQNIEQFRIQEKQTKKMRDLSGIIELESLKPTDITDKYFRILNYPPFNEAFEIVEISNITNNRPTLSKRKIKFDSDCNLVSGTKELSKDCFKTVKTENKLITNLEFDSLFILLERTEFWNLKKESYNSDEVIFDGTYVEIAAFKVKHMYADSLVSYQNVIERRIPENYIGISLISKFVNELSEK